MIVEDEHGRKSFAFQAGPIFAHLVLADEINRATPKTQSALLEAMQENHVTVGGVQHPLEQPFLVLATQNPLEMEGTYPLPEAQLDRFMFEVLVDYPAEEEELAIVKRTTSDYAPRVTPTLNAAQIQAYAHLVRRVPVADHIVRYALQLARRTRAGRPEATDMVAKYVTWGAGPRASQYLVLAAKARAALEGRFFVAGDDIAAVAAPVLRHRIITNFSAEADGVTADAIIKHLLDVTTLERAA